MSVRHVCLVGDAATGKTCLASALVEGRFCDVPTNETIFSKQLTVDGKVHLVEFVDTSSGDEYERSRVQTYPSADLFVLLFSIISPPSYESWAPEIKRYCPNKPILLVGTKADLRTDEDALERLAQRHLAPTSFEQGIKMAKEIGALTYVETSSLPSDTASFSDLLDQTTQILMGGKISHSKGKKQQQRQRSKSVPYGLGANSLAAVDGNTKKKGSCTLV